MCRDNGSDTHSYIPTLKSRRQTHGARWLLIERSTMHLEGRRCALPPTPLQLFCILGCPLSRPDALQEQHDVDQSNKLHRGCAERDEAVLCPKQGWFYELTCSDATVVMCRGITSSHLISSHITSSHLISPYLLSSLLASPHLTLSPLISSHLVQATPPPQEEPPPSSHLLSSHRISPHRLSMPLLSYITSSHLISSQLFSPHLFSPHLISPYLLSSRSSPPPFLQVPPLL